MPVYPALERSLVSNIGWKSPTIPWDLCDKTRRKQLHAVWEAGNLSWKLDPSQKLMYDMIKASHGTVKSAAERTFCLDVSRQSGKDFMMALLAVEHCIQNKRGFRIPYGCPTQETLHNLLAPTMFAIFADCPPDLQPKEIKNGTFRNSRAQLSWKHGAEIHLVGVDLHPAWLRGPASEVFFLTEPAFMDHLEELLYGILYPQQLTIPHGWSVLASTPPESPGHFWTQQVLPRAKDRNMYAKRTILDCPRFTPEQVEGIIRESGGRKATRVRRELFVEHVIESTLAAVPEFNDVKDQVVTDQYVLPEFRDTYVAIDPGFSHATGAVFGYLDFLQNVFVIEGDFAVQGLNSREVSRYIKAREWQLWGREPVKPGAWKDEEWQNELKLIRALFYANLTVPAPVKSYRNGEIKHNTFLRVSDTDSRLISDLSVEHGLTFSPTEKTEMEVNLNHARVKLAELKYKIHPRCHNTISHLEQAIWNKTRTKLAESGTGAHFDCLPAWVYLNRNIVWGKNPFPPHGVSRITHHVPNADKPQSKTATALSAIFGRRKR